ncbi:MAG: MoaD/ThiS family protein [Pirellulales bacterium]
MNVRVKLFAVARELAGVNELSLDVPPGATVAQLQEQVIALVPALGRIVPLSLWAVGTEYVDSHTVLAENADIALIPPVSGG